MRLEDNSYVICISGNKFLEVGKKYKVLYKDEVMWCIEDNPLNGLMGSRWFDKINFETIEDIRDKKINEIINK